MKRTNFAAAPWEGNPVASLRGNAERTKPLLSREGHRRAFEFTFVESLSGEHFSPRHRHNFDQIRILLAGHSRYGRLALKARMIGYFPEGTFYGPHTVVEYPSVIAALQFDGASGSGYINFPAIRAATEELKLRGEFRRGVYYPMHGKATEAYTAAWSHAVGRPVTFPAPRYSEPIFMHPDAFAWIPSPEPGVAMKDVGMFGEAGLRISMARVAEGARHRIADSAQSVVAFVLGGAIEENEEPLSTYSALLIEPGDDALIVGRGGEAELIEIALPALAPEPR